MTASSLWQNRPHALSVTDLAARIQDSLEADFDEVWVIGEISSLRTPTSGHLYFTLKDDRSQLRAVMFRGYAGLLRFRPEDGLEVIAWLARQPWSNGNVGMFGISWGGFNSLQLAMRQPPATSIKFFCSLPYPHSQR